MNNMTQPIWREYIKTGVKWLHRMIWLVLIADIILILIAHKLRFKEIEPAMRFVYWLLGSLAVVSTWLVIWYRAFFRTWTGWLSVLLIMFLSSLVTQEVIPVKTPPFQLFLLMLFLTCFWALGPVSGVVLWYKDKGLHFIALGSIVVVWIVTLSWSTQGNFFQLIFTLINQPATFWWLPSWLCLCIWIVPLGIVGFLGHTARLIVKEVLMQ